VSRRLAIIGAGPTGLAAALMAVRRGHDVTVLEAGRVGSGLTRWGSTRLFSPLRMNLPAEASALLPLSPEQEDRLLTGSEMVDRVLTPLAAAPPLANRVREGHRVRAVGRSGMTRQDYAGHPLRQERPFRLLVESSAGESWIEADVVLDASGSTARGTYTGPGGLPARGEESVAAALLRDLGALEVRLSELAGERVLLLGHGHSAATALLLLESLAEQGRPARVTWAVRSAQRRPCLEIAEDPLPERRRVVERANALAASPPEWLAVERKTTAEAYGAMMGGLVARLSNGEEASYRAVVAMTGWRPDLSFLSELALEISPSTEGSARLSRALSGVTDCLSVPRVAARDLASGEPGFFLVGAKSYGRSRSFLLRDGYAQLDAILESLS
jgi:thioredoxin reductase